ncbi:uncharacterized protein RCC_06783 [Ramularia collo-cygni]|uniref:Uncharacterized protein n=1 Tax=Ramularia collo-cygni TaxID=112498 RepID=A0A2D3VJ55_9PEZI|nr:uncharacterized protein RCC_06783 [Ramularia collo-cygni]CZT20923.1 uncharacterized protein RCC_06783 [Ramularia collo-cygni]
MIRPAGRNRRYCISPFQSASFAFLAYELDTASQPDGRWTKHIPPLLLRWPESRKVQCGQQRPGMGRNWPFAMQGYISPRKEQQKATKVAAGGDEKLSNPTPKDCESLIPDQHSAAISVTFLECGQSLSWASFSEKKEASMSWSPTNQIAAKMSETQPGAIIWLFGFGERERYHGTRKPWKRQKNICWRADAKRGQQVPWTSLGYGPYPGQ